MKILGIYSVLCVLIIYVAEVCDAECDEYVLVLEEFSCPNSSIYTIKPQKRPIHWDNVEYPCNSTEEEPEKEKCLLEFNCMGTEFYCQDHIEILNKTKHYITADKQTTTSRTVRTEAPDVTTNKVPVTAKPHLTLDEEFNASMYDVNLIFIKENDIQNRTNTSSKSPWNETLYCDHAETVCFGGMEPDDNNSLSEFKNVTNTSHKESTRTLLISIDRDETSQVQPIFTGYFPESSSDSSINYNGNFKYLKTLFTPCLIPRHNNCKQKLEINVYLKANYIENNTITKYPNCTKGSITSENVLNVKCEDISFAKNNRHIVQTPLTLPLKQNMWNCQIKKTKNKLLSSKDQLSENNKLHFINCSNETNISENQFKSEEVITPFPNITIHNILPKKGELNKTKTSTGEETMNKDNSSHTYPENMMTILVTENTSNCSQDTSLDIGEGKMIDLGVNNKEKIVQNNNVELILSNCIENNSSLINNKELPLKAELTIILKSTSLNASNLEQFNGTPEGRSVKQRILLRCDHLHNESSSNATSNKTTLECESIDLDFYNITGIEIHKNITLSTNKTVENNETVNNKSHEDTTKTPVEHKKVKKNISKENIAVRNLEVIFNRRKDIPNSAGQKSFSLGSPERENIFLIGLLSIVGAAILMAIVWRIWPQKKEYNPAPTREPVGDEETAF